MYCTEGSVSLYADYYTPGVGCLVFEAMSEWELGENASCQRNIDDAISLAKELNDMNSLANALQFAGIIARYNLPEVERYSSDLVELSTRHHFSYWLTSINHKLNTQLFCSMLHCV